MLSEPYLYELLILLALFLIIIYILKKNAFKTKRYPPSPWGFPIVGHLPLLGRYPPAKFKKWREIYGDVYQIRMGAWNAVVINGYPAIKDAMERPDDAFSSRPRFFIFDALKKVCGDQETVAFGPFNQSYMQLRRHCAGALNKITNTFQMYTQDIILEEAYILIDNVLAWNEEPSFIHDEIQKTVGSIIHQILFGRGKNVREDEKFQAELKSVNEFNRTSGVGNLFGAIPWLKYLMPWKVSEIYGILKKSADIRYNLTLRHMETFNEDNVREDVTDIFLSANVPDKTNDETLTVTRERLLRNLNALTGAGLETTSTYMLWLLTYMVAFPKIQEEVQSELDAVIGHGRKVLLSDRPRLPYTEATILEVFRITSAVPIATPHYTIKDTKLNGFDIDKDTVILPNQHSVNMDETFWKDSEKFRPERLLNASRELDMDKCNHIMVFGQGRRKCVGERLAKIELFLLFSNVMLRCGFTKTTEDSVDLTQVMGLAYRPKPMKIAARER